MVAWYLNRALSNFRAEVNARWPSRDRGSDGTVGDAAHQNTSSDHNPDTDGSVDAWDMDVDGVDVQAVIAAALAHESIQYVIYNRRITSRSMTGGLGTWHPYSGSNPHDKHVHFNTRPSHENSARPWFGKEDMDQATFNRLFLNAIREDSIRRELTARSWQYTGGGIPEGMSTLGVLSTTHAAVNQTVAEVAALRALVAALVSTPPGSVQISDEQLERVLRSLLGSLDDS